MHGFNEGPHDDQPVNIRGSRCTRRRCRPRRNAPCADGRTCPDRIRAGLCRQHHATDDKRPSGAYGYGGSSQSREARPASLPPSRLPGCCADDREHHAMASRPDSTRPPRVVGPKDAALRMARTCYDHLAGSLGVALADAMVESVYLELTSDGGLVTDKGIAFFRNIGVDLDALLTRSGKRSSRVLCRPCLDWSERRPHIAGSIGAALCAHSFDEGWISRLNGTRAVAITPKGQRIFREQFGASWDK
jgi:hypothetical protein